ncbi:MAG: hypothetical protein AB8B64_00005, partial [Granulosicoccus sp.]
MSPSTLFKVAITASLAVHAFGVWWLGQNDTEQPEIMQRGELVVNLTSGELGQFPTFAAISPEPEPEPESE